MEIESDQIICIEETAVTVRSYRRRTTVPSRIFQLLALQPGDSIRWVGLKDGSVTVSRVHKVSVSDRQEE